jgi:hypothetical protein
VAMEEVDCHICSLWIPDFEGFLQGVNKCAIVLRCDMCVNLSIKSSNLNRNLKMMCPTRCNLCVCMCNIYIIIYNPSSNDYLTELLGSQ